MTDIWMRKDMRTIKPVGKGIQQNSQFIIALRRGRCLPESPPYRMDWCLASSCLCQGPCKVDKFSLSLSGAKVEFQTNQSIAKVKHCPHISMAMNLFFGLVLVTVLYTFGVLNVLIIFAHIRVLNVLMIFAHIRAFQWSLYTFSLFYFHKYSGEFPPWRCSW